MQSAQSAHNRRTIVPNTSGMEQKEYPKEAVPLNVAARHLRVPAVWLRDETEAGKLPALIAGSKVLVHLPTVALLLAERATTFEGGVE